MPRRRYTTEQISNRLRKADVLISQGRSIGEVAKELAISEHAYSWGQKTRPKSKRRSHKEVDADWITLCC